MKQSLQKHSRIDALALDPNRYTETLLAAAYGAGLYDDETVFAIRGGLFELLSQRLEKLTNGESCSVSAETAQAVLSGILYTVDLRLLACAVPDDAAELLARTAPSDLYDGGLRLIKRKLQASELLYRKHLSVFRSLPESVMKTTATVGIAGFFRAYRPTEFADAVPITADYPLYLDQNEIKDLRGVTFLSRYLQGLITEARFLSKFRAETLQAVLSSADPLYRETPSNLFAPMLATAVGMALLQRPFSAWKWGLQRDDIAEIVRMYASGALTAARMQRAAETVIDLLMLDETTADYVRRALQRLYADAAAALERHLPTLIFPCTDAKVSGDSAEQITYRGGRMDAESFRCLDFDLRRCTTPDEKTALILSRICGLEDICDLLTADTGALDVADKRHLWQALPPEAQRILGVMGVDLTADG